MLGRFHYFMETAILDKMFPHSRSALRLRITGVFPRLGVDEDPVCGSAHCCLGPFWQRRLGKDNFVAYQASARGGVVKVRVAKERAFLGGKAVIVAKGELLPG